VTVPWALADRGSLFPSEARDRRALETDVLGGARVLKLSWDEAWHLMEQAVERGQKRRSDA
jgi:hypothetical protein